MKILFLLPGSPITSVQSDEQLTVELPTLAQGKRHFFLWELINNLQSVAGIVKTGQVTGDIYSFSSRKNPLHLFRSGIHIRRLIRRNQYQKVLVFWGGMSAWVSTLFSPVPVVIVFLGSDLQGSYTATGKPNTFGRMLIFFSRLACRRASGLVVMSEKMRRKIPETAQHKVLVLPEGVDLKKFCPQDKMTCRQQLGWPADKPIVIFFNNGSPVKNAPLAKQAFQALAHKMPGVILKELRGIPHDQLVYYYNAADLLLLTSLHEGSNNSLKEAMACNCPVVASPVGDAVERLTGVYPGMVTNDFSVKSFAEAMEKILNVNTRSNGREMVESVSVEQVGDKMAAFLLNNN